MTLRRIAASVLSIALLLWVSEAAAEENEQEQEHVSLKARLYLPISGAVKGGGTFAGTLSVLKFSEQDGHVVAIGTVTGSVTSREGGPLLTALAGPMSFPVQLSPGSAAPTSGAQVTAPAATCQVLHLDVGAVSLNVLGLQVTTQPISIDVSGTSGGTNVLGQLLCTILQTVGNVVGLVNLLNQLLGVLGGLTG
jgi:hypothetical protein